MNELLSFIAALFWVLLSIIAVIVITAFFGYNKLRAYSETIKEAWSNIGVAGRKQASLINQLIDVVKGYQESEKLVMLKVSEDMSNAANVAQMHQQAGMVLSSVNGLAEKFPELKASQQYQRLIDSIQSCETQLEEARASYNHTVRVYNTARSSIPTVFYAPLLGFKTAPYLEFDGQQQVVDMGDSLKSFSADDDGERINVLLGTAGNKLMAISDKAIGAGKVAAQKAMDGGKVLAEKTQDKLQEIRSEQKAAITDESNLAPAPAPTACNHCGTEVPALTAFCSGCGTKVSSEF